MTTSVTPSPEHVVRVCTPLCPIYVPSIVTCELCQLPWVVLVGPHQLPTVGTPCPPTPRRREGAGESGAHCPVQRPLQYPPQHPHQRVRNHGHVHLPPHTTVQQLQTLRVTMLRACVVTMLLTRPTAAPAPRIVEDVHPMPGRQLKDSMLTYGCSANAFACVGVVHVRERCPLIAGALLLS